ncbi:histidine kinase [Chishuiella sp.]|uniref:sensor histidine kinase n=1 Tax=Chishuiella sp. TaxID=1969467 RepID=UPI0028AFF6DB|nr:histidine kinase [Chishuiella sp.]
MNKKITKREIVIFSIISVVFILIPFLSVSNNDTANNVLFETRHFRRMLFENILLLMFFFLNYFLLIPKLYFKRKYIVYTLILIACFFIVYKIPEWSFHLQKMPRKEPPRFDKFRHDGPPPPNFVMWSPKILMFFSLAIISLFIRQNKRYVEMQEQKQLSEIAYLRAQINPHFLFNTLNNIYALTLQKSDFASDAVMKLSKMMRYVVSHSSKDFVPLREDLEYIKNYIKLQQLRLINNNSIVFQINGDVSDIKISPLLLINFIENAFKYGIIDDEYNPIKINISIDNTTLTMLVENTILEDVNLIEEQSGIGLKNTKKRLDVIYANRYQLEVKETSSNYFVRLKLFLND